jgi:hypothetical protein
MMIRKPPSYFLGGPEEIHGNPTKGSNRRVERETIRSRLVNLRHQLQDVFININYINEMLTAVNCLKTKLT